MAVHHKHKQTQTKHIYINKTTNKNLNEENQTKQTPKQTQITQTVKKKKNVTNQTNNLKTHKKKIKK